MLIHWLRWERVAFAMIMLVAAALRLYQPTLVEYFHDEAMLATMAQEMARDGIVPLTGILSSTGIPNPPTSVYVMALSFTISPDPAAATVFVMLLNIVGVGLFYLLLRRLFPMMIVITGCLLYAVSPWAIWFSRKIWAQDFHTPFLLLSVVLLIYGLTTPRYRWMQALGLPVAIFAMQIHFAAWALLPAYLLILWEHRQSVSIKALIAGLMFTGLVIAPYMIGLINTLAIDPDRISDAFSRSGGNSPAATLGLSLVQLLTLASGQIDILSANRSTAAPLTTLLFGLPLIALTIMGSIRVIRQRVPLRWAVLWWAFGPALMLTLPITPSYIHYYVASLPALTLLAAWGLAEVWRLIPAMTPRIRQSIVAGLVVLMTVHWAYILRTVATTSFSYPDFTTPLAYLLDVRHELAGANDVVVISDGMAWDLKHDVAVWETLLRDRAACVRTLRDGYRVYPANAFVALVTPDGVGTENATVYEGVNSDRTIIPARPGELFSVNSLPHVAFEIPQDITHFDNGASFIGVDDTSETLTLLWYLRQSQPRGVDFQYTLQAYDAEGNSLGQRDDRFWQGMHWCPGDVLAIDVDFTLPAATAELRVGLYRLGTHPGEYFNANVLDAAGNPSGQLVSVILN